MLTKYIQAAMSHATYKLFEDGSFWGEIPLVPGVWANASTLEACREELQDVLEDWLLASIADHDPVPVVDGIDLNAREAA